MQSVFTLVSIWESILSCITLPQQGIKWLMQLAKKDYCLSFIVYNCLCFTLFRGLCAYMSANNEWACLNLPWTGAWYATLIVQVKSIHISYFVCPSMQSLSYTWSYEYSERETDEEQSKVTCRMQQTSNDELPINGQNT